MKKNKKTNKKAKISVVFSDDPETKAALEQIRLRGANRRLEESLAEKKSEIAIYRNTLTQIRDIVLFGNTADEVKAARAKKTKPEYRHEMGKLLSVQNLAYNALNWQDIKHREEVRGLARLAGVAV